MIITSAKYGAKFGTNTCVIATIDGKGMTVPLDEGNRHYAAILEWVAEGNSIEAAD
tara:strand:+ start:370 stop:537 length:168 start_codon:yes stop_codon:yes gene_type:complete